MQELFGRWQDNPKVNPLLVQYFYIPQVARKSCCDSLIVGRTYQTIMKLTIPLTFNKLNCFCDCIPNRVARIKQFLLFVFCYLKKWELDNNEEKIPPEILSKSARIGKNTPISGLFPGGIISTTIFFDGIISIRDFFRSGFFQ